MAKIVRKWLYDPEAYEIKDFFDDIDKGSYYSNIQEFFRGNTCYIKETRQKKTNYYSLECNTTESQTSSSNVGEQNWKQEYEDAETCAEKERFFLKKNGYEYTIDIFRDPKSIGTVEVQFESAEAAGAFDPESWFLREITTDSNYTEYNIISDQEKPFYEIVLTGGPCGGKSTALSKLKSGVLKDYKVFCVSEVAADLLGGGIVPADSFECQYSMTSNMLAKREAMRIAAREHYYKTGQKAVIIYDRGIPDNKAYCSEKTWEDVLKKCKMKPGDLYSFYDAIIDIATAAEGAEEAYKANFGNNAARNPDEDVKKAVELENNIRKAYTGCNGFVTIYNPTDGGWETKLERIINAVREALGLNPVISQTQRFLVNQPQDIEQFVHDNECVVQQIEQVYLNNASPDTEHKVKKTQTGGATFYNELIRTFQEDGRFETKEHGLSRKAYGRQVAEFKDRSRTTIHKKRYLFNKSGAQYVLDIYDNVISPELQGKAILTIKGLEQGANIEEENIIPVDFRKSAIGLRNLPEYLERNIALRSNKWLREEPEDTNEASR